MAGSIFCSLFCLARASTYSRYVVLGFACAPSVLGFGMSRLSISESWDVYSDCSSMELLFFWSIAIFGVVESDWVTDSVEKFLLMLAIFLGVILNDPILGLLSFLSMFGDDI